jgi:hypothetical protein
MNFVLEKCARICLKRGIVENNMYIGNTFENEIKEFYPRNAWKYLGTEGGNDIRMRKKKRRRIT